MLGHKPRTLLLRALFLDWIGQLFIVGLISFFPDWYDFPGDGHLPFDGQGPWLIFCLFLYPLFGWLFGSYTTLRRRDLALVMLLQRLLFTSISTFVVIFIACLFVNPSIHIWMVDTRVQFLWLNLLTVWSLFVRIALRRGLLLPDKPRLFLLARSDEYGVILNSWARVATHQQLEPISPLDLERLLDDGDLPLLVVLSPSCRCDPVFSHLIERLETQDPLLASTVSVISLFEYHQGRLPPVLLGDSSCSYYELPLAAPYSVQVQLKRLADLFFAFFLLLFTSPFIGLAAFFIWLEDRGPVFYVQQRSGWLGRPFNVLKLRTMRDQHSSVDSLWTQPGDQRITAVGYWLRRLRLDELPQLLNVLSGEMSLIGPRPERPELEHDLEKHIPHYRKRHWMRPGLSGWAQVCAPYASSIEDSDLKLSYDLYYLKHFSTALDLVILFRTIKTVLKAGGR